MKRLKRITASTSIFDVTSITATEVVNLLMALPELQNLKIALGAAPNGNIQFTIGESTYELTTMPPLTGE